MKYICLFAIAATFFLGEACKKKKEVPIGFPEGATYFPVNKYVKQQAMRYAGVPITFYKISTLNGKTDSLLTNIEQIDWAPVYKTFIAADISDPKFLGKYTYSEFTDDVTGTLNMLYEAKDPDLYTRRFLINKDSETGMIRSIFIQTDKGSKREGTRQMLYYGAGDMVQIQEQQWTKAGTKTREQVVEYRFLR